VIASHFNIPDDVAGATLMAAGASSPELFSAIVALFITHSSMGIGTIVGSEIFNQLVICAGAALEGRNGQLVLDKPIVIRETGFYALSILLLYNALSVSKPLESDPDGPNHLYVKLFPTCLLVLSYILYVLVMAYFEQILTVLGVKSGQELTEEEIEANKREETHKGVSYGAINATVSVKKQGNMVQKFIFLVIHSQPFFWCVRVFCNAVSSQRITGWEPRRYIYSSKFIPSRAVAKLSNRIFRNRHFGKRFLWQ
jgi:Ca2+/Na+ antiporter